MHQRHRHRQGYCAALSRMLEKGLGGALQGVVDLGV